MVLYVQATCRVQRRGVYQAEAELQSSVDVRNSDNRATSTMQLRHCYTIIILPASYNTACFL